MFHLDAEPFVTSSGARLDEIVAAVRRCPSGALSFGLDGREDRAAVDQTRPATIEVSRDGPYRITGGVALADDTGRPLDRPEGASAEHCSLCRCGASPRKPFCSGMHWSSGFRDPEPDPAAEPTLFAEFRAAFAAYIEWGTRTALENSQSDAKPPPNMAVPRWWWVCNASPGSRMPAPYPATAPVAVIAEAPGPRQRVSFAAHVQPLFRARDRSSMRFTFDL